MEVMIEILLSGNLRKSLLKIKKLNYITNKKDFEPYLIRNISIYFNILQ